MGAYDEAIRASKPDFYEPLDAVPRRMRPRAEIVENIQAISGDSIERERSATEFAVLEVLMDIREQNAEILLFLRGKKPRSRYVGVEDGVSVPDRPRDTLRRDPSTGVKPAF